MTDTEKAFAHLWIALWQVGFQAMTERMTALTEIGASVGAAPRFYIPPSAEHERATVH